MHRWIHHSGLAAVFGSRRGEFNLESNAFVTASSTANPYEPTAINVLFFHS